MGMAASQARLLSITSRMSDNELRAQLINNAKMRLATDSARVSDEYITALNQTQFMFKNFDTTGNEQYQNLTFNSLTAYSSYNNQYGIVNNAGELLVSSQDATNFEKSNTLEDFLGCYNLAQDTTYFDKFKNNMVGYYDTYGNWQDLGVTVGAMKDIFEGNIDSDGVEHYGYADSLNSIEYGQYNSLVADYQDKKAEYKSAVNKSKNSFIDGTLALPNEANINETLTANGKNFETLYNEVSALETYNSADITKYRSAMEKLIETLNTTKTLKEDSNIFTSGLELNINLVKLPLNSVSYLYEKENKTYGYAKVDKDGNITPLISTSDFTTKYYSKEEPLVPPSGAENITIEGEDGTLYETDALNLDGVKYNQITFPDDGYNYLPLYEYLDENGVKQYTTDANQQGASRVVVSDDPSIIKNGFKVSEEFLLDTLKYLYAYFKDNALANLSDEVFMNKDKSTKDSYDAYLKSAKKLADYIYGENGSKISPEYYDYLDDPSWVLSQNQTERSVHTNYTYKDKDGNDKTIEVMSTSIDKTHYNPNKYPTTTSGSDYPITFGEEVYNPNYQVVKDLYLIECMLDQFGEPNYTWIDTENPDENAEAKAQWYTNLYTRMQNGYKTIAENLTNSQEWLKFAFESGIVHMEQVDKSNNWTSTIYSNCSNITESTVDVDVTIAEAKYKREMNKIQAKDKRYDMELKNIDTEHNSLQTEYDSIKSVIDKNVERNFKIFQA